MARAPPPDNLYLTVRCVGRSATKRGRARERRAEDAARCSELRNDVRAVGRRRGVAELERQRSP